ncbi:hypothetical protein OS493_039074 [Desmophyllum pertusum]|uniref:Endonuclease/exonuclease/phosphatase domain-containing protein n=1 Tax=Desmophyllum pertusum TaxID=174260 RepID=A0A9W9Z6A5_9CNID|nr:hypothetical protein OS493_039074 [Desmophyllum pertusum]
MDPTIFETWSRPVLQYIEQQVKAGRDPDSITEKEIQKFKQSILKSASPPSYFIMTINMNGPASGKGTAHKRRMLVSIIIRCFCPDIIFCQELPGYFKEKVAEKCGYQYVKNGKESAVLWRIEDFDDSTEGLKTTDESIIQLMDEVKGASIMKTMDTQMIQLGDKVCEVEGASKFLSKIAMVKLTSWKSFDTVLAVSYHGRYKAPKKEKHRDFKCLNTFLGEVIKEAGINSYIIGGDFNFYTLDVEMQDHAVVQHYTLSSRQEEASSGHRYIPHKDNFVYYPDGKIRVDLDKALPI